MDRDLILMIAGGVLAPICVGLYYFSTKRRAGKVVGKRGKKGTQQGVEAPNCLIMDIKRADFGLEILSQKVLKKLRDSKNGLGRQWKYENQDVYWLKRLRNGALAVVLPPVTMEDPPPLLWEALQQSEAEIVFDMTPDTNTLEKYGPYIAVFGISFFALIVLATK